MIQMKMLPEKYTWLHHHLTIISTTVDTRQAADKRIELLKKSSPIEFSEIRKRESDIQDINFAKKFLSDSKINFATGKEILDLDKGSYLDLSSNIVDNVKKLHSTYKSPLEDIWVIDLAPPQGPKLLDFIHIVRDLNMYLEFINPNLGNCFELAFSQMGKFFIKGNFHKQYGEFLSTFAKKINEISGNINNQNTANTKKLASCITLEDKVVLILDLTNAEKSEEIISQFTDEFSILSLENKTESVIEFISENPFTKK